MTGRARIQQDAELIIYNYHQMRMPVRSPDAIFCFCSLNNPRRPARSAALSRPHGPAPNILGTEAEAFTDIARRMGVPDDKIIVEPRATNTGGNVRFVHPRSLILVQKPNIRQEAVAGGGEL
ncbi:hypothetical protein ED733_008643 [Metarhizium rileyi]|uniref:DUF218 domain-containing protein n=1 Tax=Metarhizium rileyi (strain RCEF 4871) TaxID=1649241 RepID=A0A5C6GQ58_METRR|nr:hypothetical protein ED733_008643 [Metarhizium rileyi]